MARSMKLIVSIVERGKGVSMQKLYTARQVFLHLQCAGRGTATSDILDILGLGSSEKDVVLSFAAADPAAQLLQDLDSDLRGSSGATGIVFALPVSALSNLAAALVAFMAEERKQGTGGETEMEHKGENTLILVGCSRGHTDAVMSTAKAHGARGGTVIKARLAGLEELEQAYDLDLNAERELVVIVVPTGLRAPIMDAINTEHGLRSESQSLLCALPIDQIVRLG